MNQESRIALRLLPDRLSLISRAVLARDDLCASVLLETAMLEQYEECIDAALEMLRAMIVDRNFRSALLLINALSLNLYNSEAMPIAEDSP